MHILWLFPAFLSLVVMFNDEAASSECFPYGATFIKLNTTFQVPNVTRDQWWCTADRFYGWLGYVRDLKGESCDDPVYSLSRLRQDFKKMANDGAKMVRIYGPICEQALVWENIVQAAAENNLGVLGIVWIGYSDSEISGWRERKNSLLQIKYGYDIAPPATRDAVIKNIDFISAHIMPYYGTCDMPGEVWDPITQGIADFKHMIPGKQMMITQNPWGSNKNGRNRGSNCGTDVWKGVSVKGANQYWNLWTGNCQYFKQRQIGWFAHVFSADSEYNFGIYGPRSDAQPYPRSIDFYPASC